MLSNNKIFIKPSLKPVVWSALSFCFLTACGDYDERVSRYQGEAPSPDGVKIISSSSSAGGAKGVAKATDSGKASAGEAKVAKSGTAGAATSESKAENLKGGSDSMTIKSAEGTKGKVSSSGVVITGVDKNGLKVEADSAAKSKVAEGDSKQLVEKAKKKAAEFETASEDSKDAKAIVVSEAEKAVKPAADAKIVADTKKVVVPSAKTAKVADQTTTKVVKKSTVAATEKAATASVSAESVEKKMSKATELSGKLAAQKKSDLNARLEQELEKFNKTVAEAQKNAKDVVEKARTQISGKVDGGLDDILSSVQKELSKGGELNSDKLNALNTNVEQLIAGLETALQGLGTK